MDLVVKVTTGTKQTEIIEDKNNFLKIKLKAKPIKGQANKELIKILAKKFGVSQSQVEIIKGLTVKTKLVRIYL